MSGPAPCDQPTFTEAEVVACRHLLRRHSAPQAPVYRAKLVLLLHADPGLNNEAAGRQLGKHANWVRYWRRIWARESFRLHDQAGRGRKPVVSPPPGGDGGGDRLRVVGP